VKQLEPASAKFNENAFVRIAFFRPIYWLRTNWRAVRAAQGKLRRTTSNNNEKFNFH